MLAEHTSIARCPSAQTKAQAISKQKISVEGLLIHLFTKLHFIINTKIIGKRLGQKIIISHHHHNNNHNNHNHNDKGRRGFR